MNEVIEMMARVICVAQEGDCYKSGCPCFDDVKAKVNALLDLRWDCEVCKGKKEIGKVLYIPCPDCNGTGQGGKVLAVLAAKQPGILKGYYFLPSNPPDEEGYVFRRVRE